MSSPSRQLSQLSAEALAPSPDTFSWSKASSQKLVGKAHGLLIAHHMLVTGTNQTTERLECPSKSSFGGGSGTETFEEIIGCNVRQQSFFQKTILIMLNQTKATLSAMPSMTTGRCI